MFARKGFRSPRHNGSFQVRPVTMLPKHDSPEQCRLILPLAKSAPTQRPKPFLLPLLDLSFSDDDSRFADAFLICQVRTEFRRKFAVQLLSDLFQGKGVLSVESELKIEDDFGKGEETGEGV